MRAGVEVRPRDDLRVEVAWVHEFWSEHDTITAVPQGIAIQGVTGLPPSLALPTITIPRGFQDADSWRAGGEYSFKIAGYGVDARAGLAYETSAVPPEYLSLSSLDFDKWIPSLGGSLHVGDHWRFDAVVSHVFAASVYVSPDTAKIPRINPLPGNAPLEAVNGGTYSAEANLWRRLQLHLLDSEHLRGPRGPSPTLHASGPQGHSPRDDAACKEAA